MRHISALVLAATPLLVVAAAESHQLQGVGPDFTKYYQNEESFNCISYPSITLAKSQINDNYCDCPDGSDEPGTSACTYLDPLSPPQPVPQSSTGTTNTSTILPGFYCQNQGHEGQYIPFTFVNDGVCDYDSCCDGSDEWEGVGGVKCENRCEDMGKEYRKKVEIREKAAKAALKRRDALAVEAAKARQTVVDRLKKLEVEIEALGRKEKDAKAKLEDVEQKEKLRVITTGHVGKTGSRMSLLVGLAQARVAELRDAVTNVMQQRDVAVTRVAELEKILAAFKVEYNPNFNDEGVKRAVNSWDNYAASHVGENAQTDENALSDIDLHAIAKEDDATSGINWEEWFDDEESSDVAAIYKVEEYLPPAARIWIREKILVFRLMLIKNGILADNTAPGSESKLVTEARSLYQAIADDKNSKEAQLGEETRDLEKDYGQDDIFRALKGKCVSQDSGEYTYEHCWMEHTTQKPKKGGGNVNMGNFVRFDSIEVDEEVGVDGKGLGVGRRTTLVYDNGQHCWNGPNRKTIVVLACAEKDEIWKTSELEKCSYQMDVGTPVACSPGGGGEKKTPGDKDEL